MEAIARILGERQVVVCRELTKTFESIHGLPASEMLAWLGEDDNRCRGEIVLVVAGASKVDDELPAEAIRTLGLLVASCPQEGGGPHRRDPRGEEERPLQIRSRASLIAVNGN